jgi:DNA-binding CsgD family transcriptional regulator
LGLCRAKDEKNFSPSDIAKAELLVSQLSGALQKVIFMSKVTKSSEIINSICPDLPYKGMIVLDESIEPVYTNEEALRIISCLDGDKNVELERVLSLPKELYAMSRNLLESVRTKSGASPVVKVDLRSKATGQSLSSNLRIINCSQNSHLCLIYFGQSQPDELMHQQLKKLGLSRRESEVAGLVCEGLENKQIGKKLFISEYTVQNHLRSIYEKLNVKNRTTLARKVMQVDSD